MVHAEYSIVEPFFAGIWCGKSKPLLKEYLEPFVLEMKNLIANGVTVNSHKINVKFGIFICDTPARVLIKGIVSIKIKKIYQYTALVYVYCIQICL